jgi:hypothetical protein
MLSMANNSTVVGRVAPTLADFASLWARSPSGYDFLIASTMKAEWAAVHKPVISREGVYTLYTQFKVSEPDGKLVLCHRMCKASISSKSRPNVVRFICSACGSRCSTPKFTSNRETLLGHRQLRKTTFPQEQYPTEWELPKKVDDGQQSDSETSALPEGSVATEETADSAADPPNPAVDPPNPITADHRRRPTTTLDKRPSIVVGSLLPVRSKSGQSVPPSTSAAPLLRSSSLPRREPPPMPSDRSSSRLSRPRSIPLLGGLQPSTPSTPSRSSSSSQTRSSKRLVEKEVDVKKKRQKTE